MRTYKHSLFDIFKSKKRCDIWTKEYWKNYAENVHQKLIPDHPFLILVNNLKQPLHARNSFTNQIFWKRIFKKALKKLTLFFFLTACHLYVTRMSPVCFSYVLVCHSYVTRLWFYHKPYQIFSKVVMLLLIHSKFVSFATSIRNFLIYHFFVRKCRARYFFVRNC